MTISPEAVAILGTLCAILGAALGYAFRMGRQAQAVNTQQDTLKELRDDMKAIKQRLDNGSVTLGRLEKGLSSLEGRVGRIESVMNGYLESKMQGGV